MRVPDSGFWWFGKSFLRSLFLLPILFLGFIYSPANHAQEGENFEEIELPDWLFDALMEEGGEDLLDESDEAAAEPEEEKEAETDQPTTTSPTPSPATTPSGVSSRPPWLQDSGAAAPAVASVEEETGTEVKAEQEKLTGTVEPDATTSAGEPAAGPKPPWLQDSAAATPVATPEPTEEEPREAERAEEMAKPTPAPVEPAPVEPVTAKPAAVKPGAVEPKEAVGAEAAPEQADKKAAAPPKPEEKKKVDEKPGEKGDMPIPPTLDEGESAAEEAPGEVDIAGGGNWLLKRQWWEKAEDKYSELKDALKGVMEVRATYFNKRNTTDDKLDKFYGDIGFDRGELEEAVDVLLDRLESQREEDEGLPPEGRSMIDELSNRKGTIQQTAKDVSAVNELDMKIDEVLSVVLEQVNKASDYDGEAWTLLQEIAQVMDEEEARQKYEEVGTVKQNVASIKEYLSGVLLDYFNETISTMDSQISKVRGSIESLQKSGIDLKNSVDELEKSIEKEERERLKKKLEEEAEKSIHKKVEKAVNEFEKKEKTDKRPMGKEVEPEGFWSSLFSMVSSSVKFTGEIATKVWMSVKRQFIKMLGWVGLGRKPAASEAEAESVAGKGEKEQEPKPKEEARPEQLPKPAVGLTKPEKAESLAKKEVKPPAPPKLPDADKKKPEPKPELKEKESKKTEETAKDEGHEPGAGRVPEPSADEGASAPKKPKTPAVDSKRPPLPWLK